MSLLETTFISLGINYAPDKFKSLRNFNSYGDLYNPPVKPTYGGLWASPYTKDSLYTSPWHAFVSQYGDTKLKSALSRPSTLFKLTPTSRILYIKSLDEITLQEASCDNKLYIPTFLPICTPSIPKELRKLRFIDYKSLSKTYDAIYIDMNVLDSTLNTLQWNDICTFIEYSYELQKAILFHSWDVPTLLVLNKGCADILDTIPPLKS